MAFGGLPPGSAVVFEQVALDGRTGPEAVALPIKPEPDELLARRSLDLNLKGSIAATPFGSFPFPIWRISGDIGSVLPGIAPGNPRRLRLHRRVPTQLPNRP